MNKCGYFSDSCSADFCSFETKASVYLGHIRAVALCGPSQLQHLGVALQSVYGYS